MSTFTPFFRGSSQKLPNQAQRSAKQGGSITVLKDFLPISSWLAIGATLNGLLFLALGRIALIIPVVFLLAKLGDALMIAYGLKPNPWMKDVINSKFSAQFPNDDGSFGPKPAAKGVTVLLIGTRSNHPMGILAPGFKETGEHMNRMQKEIDERAAEYGLLGASTWLGAERSSGNEIMYVMYFKDPEGLHRFAHDETHRNAWNWWSKTYKKHPYISIWHEIFVAPAGKWETIYANSHPTLLAASSINVAADKDTKWFSPVVDASRGVLKSSRGRMTLTDGEDNEKYGYEAYTSPVLRA